MGMKKRGARTAVAALALFLGCSMTTAPGVPRYGSDTRK